MIENGEFNHLIIILIDENIIKKWDKKLDKRVYLVYVALNYILITGSII